MIVAPEENSPDNPKLSVFDRILCNSANNLFNYFQIHHWREEAAAVAREAQTRHEKRKWKGIKKCNFLPTFKEMELYDFYLCSFVRGIHIIITQARPSSTLKRGRSIQKVSFDKKIWPKLKFWTKEFKRTFNALGFYWGRKGTRLGQEEIGIWLLIAKIQINTIKKSNPAYHKPTYINNQNFTNLPCYNFQLLSFRPPVLPTE